MSVETDYRAALAAHAPLVALVGQRIAVNAAPQGWALPFVVYTTSHSPEYALSGAPLGNSCAVEGECWGSTAAQSAAVADAVVAALVAVGVVPTGRSTSHDPDVGLDADIVTCTWLTG